MGGVLQDAIMRKRKINNEKCKFFVVSLPILLTESLQLETLSSTYDSAKLFLIVPARAFIPFNLFTNWLIHLCVYASIISIETQNGTSDNKKHSKEMFLFKMYGFAQTSGGTPNVVSILFDLLSDEYHGLSKPNWRLLIPIYRGRQTKYLLISTRFALKFIFFRYLYTYKCGHFNLGCFVCTF